MNIAGARATLGTRPIHGSVWLLAACSGIALPGAAYAQASQQPAASPAPGGPQPSSDALQEIVVTAQKRAQSLNDVGMSITALTGGQLAQQGIVSTADLVKVVPGLTFAESQKGAPVYTIRGVGYYEESLAAAPAVSVYTDEVAYPFPVMTKAATLDLERVEVLKGPQGTLYGQNATGGAINYIAAKPTDHPTAGFDWTYARFDAVSVDGYVSGPLAPNLLARLSFAVDEGGAYQKSYTRGDRNGAKDVKKARLLLEWTPTDKLKIGLNLNGWKDNSQSEASAFVALTPQDPQFVFPEETTQVPAPHKAGTADWTPGVPRRLDETFYQGALRIDYNFSDAIGLTSLSTYEHYSQDDNRDVDGSALDEYHIAQTGKVESYGEELRLHGTLAADTLNWIVGGQYAHDKAHEFNTEYLTFASLSGAFSPFGLGNFPGVAQLGDNRIRTAAAFGNLEYKVTPAITLHAGARYTDSDTKFSGCSPTIDPILGEGSATVVNLFRAAEGLAPIPAIPVGGCTTVTADLVPALIQHDLHQHNVSWRGGADWKINPSTLVYASVSKGYKAGGFPTLGSPSYVQVEGVTQESVLAYEVGLKYTTRRFQFDAALFDYNYRNKQLRARTLDPLGIFGAVETLVNIPKSVVRGGEATVSWKPVRGLTLTASGTYLHSKVSDHFDNYDPFGNPVDFKGESFPFTPKWSAQFTPYYETRLTDHLNGFLGGNLTYQSKTTSAFGDSPLMTIKAYALVDLRAGVAAPDGNWRLTFWGRNITNKYYWTDTFREGDNLSRHVGAPAIFGATFSKKF